MDISPRQKGAIRARAHHASARTDFLDRIAPFFAGRDVIGGPLLLATLIALVCTNSPFQQDYERLWDMPLTIMLGDLSVRHSLAEWIDHALLPLFFIIIGTDVKRELVRGELSRWRTAAFPIAGAAGGMLVPVLLYLLIAGGTEVETGWGTVITMDTAFGLALIGIFATSLPPGVRALFLAFAAIDDIGGLLVIAIAYSQGIHVAGILLGCAAFAGIYLLRRLKWGASLPYVLLALLLWAGIFQSGIHTTIAGVLIGFLVPVHPRLRRAQFADKVQEKVDEFQAAHDHAGESDDEEESSAADQKAEEQLGYLHEMTGATHETGERLIALLTPWISYIVLPLFALSNVRVHMSADLVTAALGSALAPAIIAGLVVGKPVGFLGFSWIATRLRLAEAPKNVTWPMIAAIGCTAGIGFTISLFISSLAFADEPTREVAAFAIILASLLAGIAGYLALRLAAKKPAKMQRP